MVARGSQVAHRSKCSSARRKCAATASDTSLLIAASISASDRCWWYGRLDELMNTSGSNPLLQTVDRFHMRNNPPTITRALPAYSEKIAVSVELITYEDHK